MEKNEATKKHDMILKTMQKDLDQTKTLLLDCQNQKIWVESNLTTHKSKLLSITKELEAKKNESKIELTNSIKAKDKFSHELTISNNSLISKELECNSYKTKIDALNKELVSGNKKVIDLECEVNGLKSEKEELKHKNENG